MKSTVIECPECAGHGGEGIYCEDCLSTGRITVYGPPAEVIDQLRAELAAERQRAEAAEKDAVAFRCLAYECTQRKDIAEAALAAERVRVAELEAHLAARQRRAELDAGGIGAVCPACGYELDEHGWCGMCTPEAVQP